jgi:hypothetical protein
MVEIRIYLRKIQTPAITILAGVCALLRFF